jgi:hypothetical protein
VRPWPALLVFALTGCLANTVPERPPVDAGPEVPSDPCAESDHDGDGYGADPSCPVRDCDDANFGVHPGALEACNGIDEDCDGDLDEDLGEGWCGTGACRVRVPNCQDGRPAACQSAATGNAESCNGVDDDCDGAVDEDLRGEACGVGACQRRSTCAGGGWQACVPGAPAEEACNGADDDCDGEVDEGLGVLLEEGSYLALSGLHSGCDGGSQRAGPECNAAIHRHCAAKACATSGFGPLENSGDLAYLACVAATVQGVSYADLAARHPGCDGVNQRIGPECNAAIHRHCSQTGFVTGFGPVEHSGGGATLACLGPNIATVLQTTYTELAQHHGGCTASRRIGPDCNAAINRFCHARQMATGFGPLENSGDVAVVACVAP